MAFYPKYFSIDFMNLYKNKDTQDNSITVKNFNVLTIINQAYSQYSDCPSWPNIFFSPLMWYLTKEQSLVFYLVEGCLTCHLI